MMMNMRTVCMAAMRKAAADAEQQQPPFWLQDAVGRPPNYSNFPLGTEQLPSDGMYTIRPNDNPYRLQQRFGISKEDLYAANPGMSDATATKWQIGQRIRLPSQTLRQKLSSEEFDPESVRDMDPDLLDSMTFVESRFNPRAYNTQGNAYGELQITQPLLDQAKKWDKRLAGWTLEDMYNPEKARFVRQTFHNGRQLDYQYQNGAKTPDSMFIRWWHRSGDPNGADATEYLDRVTKAPLTPGYDEAREMYHIEQQ